MTTNPEAGMRLEPFERYPALASWIAKMAARYTGLSLGEWMTFVGALNAALVTAEAAAPVPSAGSEDWSDLLRIVEETPENGYEVDHRYIDAVLPSVVRRLILAARAQPPVGEDFPLAVLVATKQALYSGGAPDPELHDARIVLAALEKAGLLAASGEK